MEAVFRTRRAGVLFSVLLLTSLLQSIHARDLAAEEVYPNDPLFRGDPFGGVEEQWNLMSDGRGIGATEAWEITKGSPDVVIANLDSGIHYRHEDLRNQIYLNRGELPLPLDAQGRPSENYDLNQDGIFNVLDYGQDSRVADLLGDGVDVGDLLEAFSDGVDHDLNGYVDDLSGWDFFDDDNDVFDATSYGHGTGTASVHSAETDNGKGIASVAPGCRLMALRMGDTPHVSHSHILAEAVIYAADNGANVLSMSLGCMSNTPFLREAFRYAREQGAVSVSAMGNEYSFHHNVPAFYDEVIGVGAIHPNTSGLPYPIFFPTSWVTRANYSDYGAHIDVAAPSWVRNVRFPDGYENHAGGTSNATPHVAGVAALVFSQGLRLGIEPALSADEVRQIIRQTAEDITGTVYGCQEGFDQWTGYGRVRADRAVLSLSLQSVPRVPPVARILSPPWYGTVDPSRSPFLSIEGEARADRSTGYQYELQWAAGVDPAQGSFQRICSSGMLSQPFLGELCRWDVRSAALESSPVPSSPNEPAVTLRLVVTDTDDSRAEARRVLFLHHDPTLHTGFPKRLDASGEASPRLVDLDGDNRKEIILATSDGQVTALREDGSLFESLHGRQTAWPVRLDLADHLSPENPGNHLDAPAFRSGAVSPARIPVVATPAVGDLDRDGLYEIVVAAMNGKIYVFEADGSSREGFPVSADPDLAREDPRLESRFLSSPVLADIDLDGFLEIIAAAMDQRIYAWDGDGIPVPGWPALARNPDGGKIDKIVSTVAVGDIDGLPEADGFLHPEIVVGTNELFGDLPSQSARLYAFHYDGRLATGWPVEVPTPAGEMLPTVGKGHPMSPLLVDLDGNDGLEVVSYAVMGTPMIVSGNGTVLSTVNAGSFGPASNSGEGLFLALPANAALGDLNGDGSPELVTGGVGGRIILARLFEGLKADFDHLLGCWDLKQGKFLPAFPRVVEGFHFITHPAIADVSGDGVPEILDGNSHYLLHAFDGQGREPQGWPKFTGGWIVCAPTVGDMDADGLLEVLLNTREGDLLAWDTQGDARQEPMWWSFHHDNHATGNYHVDTEPPDAIEDLRVTRAEGEGHPGLRLTWTAVGDNAKQGRATAYEIRSHSESIDPFNWPEAQTVTVSLTPREAGESESVFLPDLSPDTFVAVRAVDEAGNLSGLYPEQAEPPASGGSENAHGGCGCSLFPGTGPKGPWQPSLAAAVLYVLPAVFVWLLKKRGRKFSEPGRR